MTLQLAAHKPILQSRAAAPAWIVFVFALAVFVWFFHGVGWNQNASFALMRSLVERHTADITPFASQTGDVAHWHGHLYAAKPPGLALLGAPFYWVLLQLERLAGVDAFAPATIVANQYAMTILLSALPAALTAAMMLLAFLGDGEGARRRDAMILAGAFAFGSLLLPYAGVMMNHSIVAAALLGAWLLVTRDPSNGRILAAGISLGLAAICGYWAGPLAVAFFIYLLAKRIPLPRAMLLAIGPLAGVAILLTFNHFAFGQWLTTGYAHESAQFRDRHLLLGVFDWPDPRRLYWVTFHRMRGLFIVCPVFDILFLSLFAWLLQPARRPLSAAAWLAIAIVAWFLLFQLTFIGWTGGAGVGPRYLTPALPLLFLAARRGWDRFPRISTALIALSIAQMLIITATQPLSPANEQGPPQHYDPLGSALVNFGTGRLAIAPKATNLGMIMGLRGRWSLVPVAMIVVGYFLVAGVDKDEARNKSEIL